jgi:hypothetical protein
MIDYPNQIPFETVLLLDIKKEPSLTMKNLMIVDYEGETKFKSSK